MLSNRMSTTIRNGCPGILLDKRDKCDVICQNQAFVAEMRCRVVILL